VGQSEIDLQSNRPYRNITVRPEAHIHTFHSFFRYYQLLNLNLPLVEKAAEIRPLLSSIAIKVELRYNKRD